MKLTINVWFYLVLFPVFCASAAVEKCDDGYVKGPSKCYLIETRSMSYYAAVARCRIKHGQLASISNETILNFLSQETNKADQLQFWVSLRTRNNKLQWGDGTIADGQKWVEKPEAPSHPFACWVFGGSNVTQGMCHHSSNIGLICEQNVQTFETLDCPTGTVQARHANECLWLSNQVMGKDEAERLCHNSDGTLFKFDEIPEEGIDNLVKDLNLESLSDPIWTNFKVNESGQLLENASFGANYTFEKGRGSCISWMYKRDYEIPIILYQVVCEEKAYAICHGPPIPPTTEPSTSSTPSTSFIETTRPFVTTTSSPGLYSTTYSIRTPRLGSDRGPQVYGTSLVCPHGYNWKEDPKTGFCYWETSYETPKLSWKKAREYCQIYGGDLASFHSEGEERIGLSFQYRSSHPYPYWIGLHLDVATENYTWVDGSEMNYTNWAGRGQPNHKGFRMRCAMMDATLTHWRLSYCGMVNWFVCKAPKTQNPPIPRSPEPEKFESCSTSKDSKGIFFDGYCYEIVSSKYDWYRAQRYCKNQGSYLVSVHSERELDFLILMLYRESSVTANRVWMGLNALGFHNSYVWSDGSPVNFVHWNENEPNNFLKQEKCCSMYVTHGLWNDENCNNQMNFICKRRNDSSSEPIPTTTPAPLEGNCGYKWHAFGDNCYLPIGERKSDWLNWTSASSVCQDYGAFLTSVNNPEEQAFLTYLMQNLKGDTWIGSHDTAEETVFVWQDNSPFFYTNWAYGEPSLHGRKEDCVTMSYSTVLDNGLWRDDDCSKKYPFVCRKRKDPNIPANQTSRSMRCMFPEDWWKLESSCFQFFNLSASWQEANEFCVHNGGNLVSISDTSVKAVVKFLTSAFNESIWIGLVKQENNSYEWLNRRHMKFSNWDTNMPNGDVVNKCYISSPDGYWSTKPCDTKMNFVCQITGGNQPIQRKQHTAYCTDTIGSSWKAIHGKCLDVFRSKQDFHNSSFTCYSKGANLVSIHSLTEARKIATLVKEQTVDSFYIGLGRNAKDGFLWIDGTPLDFDNWERDNPKTEPLFNCVQMSPETLKWRSVPCTTKLISICETKAVKNESQESDVAPTQANLQDKDEADSSDGLSGGSIAAIALSIILVVAILVAVAIVCRPTGWRRMHRRTSQTTSFANALYNADSTMELQTEEGKISLLHHGDTSCIQNDI